MKYNPSKTLLEFKPQPQCAPSKHLTSHAPSSGQANAEEEVWGLSGACLACCILHSPLGPSCRHAHLHLTPSLLWKLRISGVGFKRSEWPGVKLIFGFHFGVRGNTMSMQKPQFLKACAELGWRKERHKQLAVWKPVRQRTHVITELAKWGPAGMDKFDV